jgi:adenine-specific DNA methylase
MIAEAPLDPAELRKARGAFFTPPRMVEMIVDWAVQNPTDTVLEPSCGEAEFLLAAGRRLRALEADWPLDHQLCGIEVHADSAAAARRVLVNHGLRPTIHVGDFFDTDLGEPVDVVIGNPPYVRYQAFTGAARAKAQAAALEAGVRLTGLASSWAAFVVRSGQLLAPDGRLGLVLPAELLSVNYAAEVRRYLMERFARVELVVFDERVFPGVAEEVVLLLASGQGPTEEVLVKQVRNLADLSSPPLAGWAPGRPADKWTPVLLPRRALRPYTSAVTDGFAALESWGSTDLGAVTGANAYFALSSAEAQRLDLDPSDLLAVSPPGSRHLRHLRFAQRDWERMRDEGAQVYLFYPRTGPLSPAVTNYVDRGAGEGVPDAYKCRVRRPWWRVPVVAAPDLFLTYMNHTTARLVANEAGVTYLNSVHGVRLRSKVRELGTELLPLATLNTVTMLGAELVGRSYGGGILKLEPTEADRLPVPSVATLQAARPLLLEATSAAERLLVAGRWEQARHLVDDILLHRTMNLDPKKVEVMRDAHRALMARRTSRARAA